jgi:hypothetical protein
MSEYKEPKNCKGCEDNYNPDGTDCYMFREKSEECLRNIKKE